VKQAGSGLVALLLLSCLTQSASAQAPAAERPRTAIGDSWTFEVKDRLNASGKVRLEVIEVGESTIKVKSTGLQGDRELVWNLDNNAMSTSQGYVARPHDARYMFPLSVGQSWPVEFDWVSSKGERGRSSGKAHVASLEKVQVPAGVFDAYKVSTYVHYNNYSDDGRGTDEITSWYAPSVRVSVKRTRKVIGRRGIYEDSTWELIETTVK
jgi:hypothetical protein